MKSGDQVILWIKRADGETPAPILKEILLEDGKIYAVSGKGTMPGWPDHVLLKSEHLRVTPTFTAGDALYIYEEDFLIPPP